MNKINLVGNPDLTLFNLKLNKNRYKDLKDFLKKI